MMEKIIHYMPKDAIEAARVFQICTRLKAAGTRLRAGVLESPNEPARGMSLPPAAGSLGELEGLGPNDGATVIVSHGAMVRIEEISKDDYLAVVGGGVRFGDFASAAREAGLIFPHEPDERTVAMTVAGLIMSGMRFPTDARFGGLREYILALELAIPKGEVIRTGSRAVKDVTGYDLAGFVMGSGGRCGIIARATLRLLPAPRGRRGGQDADVQALHEAAGESVLRAGHGAAPESVDSRGGAAAPRCGPRGSGAGDGRSGEGAAILDELASRTYGIFDPELIMLP